MNIIRICLYKYNTPFELNFHSSHGFRKNSESIIIKCDFDNGISGFGESAPRQYVTGENYTTVTETIKNHFSPVLFSYDINSLNDIIEILNRLEAVCLKNKIFSYNSALGAIDIALLDALGKYKKMTVNNFLGNVVDKIPSYSLSIPFLTSEKINELYFKFKDLNFKYIKILINEIESENISRVSQIRSLLGDKVNIRLEANGKLTFKQAVSNIKKLQKYNITAIEEPLGNRDIRGLKKLKKTIELPVIIDESMCSLSDAKKLIENDACDILNIKISKCGGIINSKKIADFARSHNKLCQLGAHVGETDILTSAAKHFALSTPDLIYFEGCSFLLFKDYWQKKEKKYISDKPEINSDYGLGISLKNQELILQQCELIFESHGRS